MNYNKLTIKMQEALAVAQESAMEAGHPEVGALHLLRGLLEQSEGIAGPVLEKAGVSPGDIDRKRGSDHRG